MSEAGERAARRSPWSVWTARALVAGGSACALGLIAGWCGAAWWVLDLCAHFRVQQVAGLLVAAGGLALLRARVRGAIFLLLALLGGWRLVPYWSGGAVARAGDLRLRVASLNVECGNRSFAEMRAFVRESDADVLLLIEVEPETLAALEPELRAYPQRLEVPRPDPFGIALYSRLPMQAERVDDLGTTRMPAILAELELGGSRVRLLGVHLLPPLSASNAAERDRALERAVETLCSRPEPSILLGDLNTTPWAESLERLAYSRGLRDARLGHGVLPSWPADSWLLRIPIDHCLLRGDWHVRSARVGEPLGSDHLGLVVDLAVAR